MKKLLLAVHVTAFFLAGCDKAEPVKEAVKEPAVSNKSEAWSLSAEPQKAQPTFGDPSLPLTSYQSLDALPGGAALTFVVLARTSENIPKDQVMSFLVPEYLNTNDAFKRHEIEQSRSGEVDAKLKSYRDNAYYSVPIVGSAVTSGIGLQNVSLGPYDFDKSSFPITSYGQYCWSNPISNTQGMGLRILPSNTPCELKVTDTDKARRIEALRSQGNLGMTGALYVHVQGAEGSTANADVVHAEVSLIDTAGQTPVAKFNL
ncbi:hypothetical protein [Pseudomonas sp. PS02302]|jgi:hypothetical protein|uniref:hypothetical protein n=1 Tax=Pseudomonas sp. PS02302 TaxID=2991428 RepID=UPI00249CC814|nr:hypothetical protein [Pseudomonas sp. PS02302]